ncbi:LysR family transcriptional regulator [Phycicoccus sp. M110.8]|uniref:LysR family transcriptional regulator n=1 Tax=Phycicoccus sp. M110.8 TaxID=3075433 RepID=UPI0028FD98A7|nr:LysR family transcriptional regulator [Phycicoccus sp. M110.8]MDU0314263.1 LysR family transcriptional regulator [Phycicoccus sp. M110.8]
MELRQVQAFLAVAEHGGFRRAAARTYVSQPALSAQVRDLERGLGVTLLVRRTDGVELTAAGAALLGPAQHLVDAVESARRTAANLRHTGTVTVGLMPGGAAELTTPLLTGLASRFPGVHVVVRDVELRAWHDDLCDELDLLVASPPWPDRELLVTELLDDEVVLAYPWNLLPDRPGVIRLEDALRLPLADLAAETGQAVTRFWTLAWLTNGAADYRRAGPPVGGIEQTRDAILSGTVGAFGPGWVARVLGSPEYGTARLAEHPAAGVRLLSRPQPPEVVQAMHVEARHIVREIGPWVLGSPLDPAPGGGVSP